MKLMKRTNLRESRVESQDARWQTFHLKETHKDRKEKESKHLKIKEI